MPTHTRTPDPAHWNNSTWEAAAAVVASRSRLTSAWMSGLTTTETPLPLRATAQPPQLLLQTVVIKGARTSEGTIIRAVALPWYDIVAAIQKDPRAAYQIPPDKWEEIIAGAYKKAKWDEVTLTPRSGDHGRDVIAIKNGICSVRVIDQVKAFNPSHLVTANDVRALLGVLQGDGASKGCLTTTSDFAPTLKEDPFIKPWIPSRIDLVNGKELFARLEKLASEDDWIA
jgi:restriction system protein